MAARDLEVENRLALFERRTIAAEEGLNAVDQRLGATARLVERLDEYAASVAAHSARLDDLTVEHRAAIEALAANFEAKLKTIEKAFKDRDDRIRELQQASYTAPAASTSPSPGVVETAGLALLRGRLDDMAREDLKNSERCQELGDRIVAMNVTVQEGQAAAAYELVQVVGSIYARRPLRGSHT